MTDRVTITLSDLHCEEQSEAGGCEPYLFASFFSVTDSGVEVQTPAHHDVRGAFANDVVAGQTLPVPQELGTASFSGGSQVGVIALVIDEDLSRDVAVEKAHQAFHAEVEAQLNAQRGNVDAEQLREAVLSKVRSAVHGTYNWQDLHSDQDDHLGLGVYTADPSQGGDFELPVEGDGDRFVLRGRVQAG